MQQLFAMDNSQKSKLPIYWHITSSIGQKATNRGNSLIFSHLIPFSFVHWIRKFLALSIIHHHPNDTKENSILLTIIILTMMMRWTNYFLFAFISCFRVFCKFIGYSLEIFLRKGLSIFLFDRTSINSGVICISLYSLLSII